MQAHFAVGAGGQPSILVRVARLGLMLMPAALLAASSLRATGAAQSLLWLGTLFQVLACMLALFTWRGWREPTGAAVIMLYVIALSWLLLGAAGRDDWFTHLAQAVLLMVPLGFFAAQCLRESGATALRRARQLAHRVATRSEWPVDLRACRLLPEVKALREALHVDASPALALLNNPRAPVRVAALAALEFRQNWRPGQPEVVLNVAQRIQEPEVRAAAINALANVDDRLLIESLAEFLRDHSQLVRQTATEALLWDTERRWPWIRMAVRTALADPTNADDGPLRYEGNPLTEEAVDDLTAWATEKGVLALRAAQTLGLHYNQALAAGCAPAALQNLRRQLADVHAPAMLRLELARVLQHHRELDNSLLLQLLNAPTPAPVRLIAVESLLAQGTSPEAVAALRDLARLPNREIALATAELVQRRLGADLGLPRGQPLPPVHSRLASEVARRLLGWAAQSEPPPAEDTPAPAGLDQPAWRPFSEVPE